MAFDSYGDYIKTYKTPKAMANAILNGGGFTTQDTRTYNLCTGAGEDDRVGWFDTTAPVSPVSSKSVWFLHLLPHPWTEEVSDMVWEGLDWSEVTEDSVEPGNDVAVKGWECRIIVNIHF